MHFLEVELVYNMIVKSALLLTTLNRSELNIELLNEYENEEQLNNKCCHAIF